MHRTEQVTQRCISGFALNAPYGRLDYFDQGDLM